MSCYEPDIFRSSEFQNRWVTAEFASSIHGNPYRTLPKGMPIRFTPDLFSGAH